MTNILERFYQYLKERFPLKDFVPLSMLLAFTAGIYIQVYIYRSIKDTPSLFLGFFAFFLFLLRLRLFDEFKDFEHDSRYYPTRPVPRGLITLKDLNIFIVFILCVEMIIAVSKGYSSLALFSLAFIYSLLMLKEFFLREWLRRHFTVYIASHEILVFPLFLYIFTLNGMVASHIGQIYIWILALFLGCQLFLLEVSRKIRPVELEIPSHDTYTSQYGIRGASALVVCLGTAVVFLKVLIGIIIYGRGSLLDCLPLLLLIVLVFTVFSFARRPNVAYAKKILSSSVLFVLVADLVLIAQVFIKQL